MDRCNGTGEYGNRGRGFVDQALEGAGSAKLVYQNLGPHPGLNIAPLINADLRQQFLS